MSIAVCIAQDHVDVDAWTWHDVDDACELIMNEYRIRELGAFPPTLRVYANEVSQLTDITPHDDATFKALNKQDRIVCVLMPAGVETFLLVVAAVVLTVAAVILLTPQIPAARNRQTESPNGSLADRTNQPRINGRIADIFGAARSTPDLLSPPYNTYVNHQKTETMLACIGRGEYSIQASDVYDDVTRVSDIAGASVEIYGPGTSPNSGGSPQLRVGNAITEPPLAARPSNTVNGQTLRPPNADSISGAGDIRFTSPDQVQLNLVGGSDFTEVFQNGDTVTISNAATTVTIAGSGVTQVSDAKFTATGTIVLATDNTSAFTVGNTITVSGAYYEYNAGANSIDLDGTYVIQGLTASIITLQTPASVNTDWNLIDGNFAGDETPDASITLEEPSGSTAVDLAGTYTILSVSSTTLTLSNPSAVNADWATLASASGGQTGYISPTLSKTSTVWIDGGVLASPTRTLVYCNFIAPQGLYKDNGKKQIRADVTVQVGVTPVDDNDVASGAEVFYSHNIDGSATTTTGRGTTLKITTATTGRVRVRARRVTARDLDFDGQVVDEVKWEVLYGMSPITQNDFGYITTTYSVTYATAGATSLKKRKLNVDVVRMIPLRVAGSTFDAFNSPTTNVADIMSYIATEPYLGRRTTDEVDYDSLYDNVAAVQAYFDHADAVSFNYTFSEGDLSAQEMLTAVAGAAFCAPYIQGRQLRIKPELADDDSELLLNHRNKLPRTEKRVVRFGNHEEYDGVILSYADPTDGAIVTRTLPTGAAPTNPKELETLGIRSHLAADWHTYRAWNKIRYQNTSVDVECTQEAAVLLRGSRVIMADNTRTGTQDGEITSQAGVVVTTSAPVVYEAGKTYRMFMQHHDASVEAIVVTAGADAYTHTLAAVPRLPLAVDAELYARATYEVVPNDSPRVRDFIVTEREVQDGMVHSVSAVNYTGAYHLRDTLNGHIDDGTTDTSFYAHTLTPSGLPTTVIDADRGTVYRANDATSALVMPAEATTANYSKTLWVKLDAASGNNNLMSSAAGVGANEALLFAGTRLRCGHAGAFTLINYDTTGIYTLTEWNHVAVTYDAATAVMRAYINGELVETALGVVQRTLAATQWGRYSGGANGLIGCMDDMRLYGRALTAGEIIALFKLTR